MKKKWPTQNVNVLLLKLHEKEAASILKNEKLQMKLEKTFFIHQKWKRRLLMELENTEQIYQMKNEKKLFYKENKILVRVSVETKANIYLMKTNSINHRQP